MGWGAAFGLLVSQHHFLLKITSRGVLHHNRLAIHRVGTHEDHAIVAILVCITRTNINKDDSSNNSFPIAMQSMCCLVNYHIVVMTFYELRLLLITVTVQL